jgi:hypothetical protein
MRVMRMVEEVEFAFELVEKDRERDFRPSGEG